jgi:hypothetical protein
MFVARGGVVLRGAGKGGAVIVVVVVHHYAGDDDALAFLYASV